MKTIEMRTFFRNGNSDWMDRDNNALGVVRGQGSGDWETLTVGGETFLVFTKEPYINRAVGGVEIGYTCFPKTQGLAYFSRFETDAVPLHIKGSEIVETYSRNGIQVIGFYEMSETDREFLAAGAEMTEADWLAYGSASNGG